jgi:hypothetical protein
MRFMRLAAVSMLAFAVTGVSALRADDAAPPAKPAPAEPKKDADTLRVDRAKAIIKDLEAAVARAKAAQPVDIELVAKVLAALEQAKALASPAKPSELTPDEKKAVVDDAKKAAGGDPAKDAQSEQADRLFAKAFDGADLSEEESIKAKSIIGDWYKDSMSSLGDSKKQAEIKRKRDDDLEKALGKKKAQKVINNLNAMGPGRGR